MLELKNELRSPGFFKNCREICRCSMSPVDYYPTGNLYSYSDSEHDIPPLLIYVGDDLLIIAACGECDSDKIVFKKIVNWLCCIKSGDFGSLHHDDRPYYAARLDKNTKRLKVFCLEPGSWINLIKFNALENQAAKTMNSHNNRNGSDLDFSRPGDSPDL
ncbi:MAG: hypothetical protein GWN00_35455 [Aliifodinibius sp.]|nr:hypothetical protein [candidate division Zixibacteria bacterium]NIT61315.1 hypothetical protein [Fodinibius sp.]NIW42650.1 hypothetical protein [candidate division Zixibacteria bacterium]NIX59252.1 hypothetical protein [candidate division Zixibacteria bacterium]NIY29895.1 hypothetical protein [Fodinibius sp.]